MKYSIADIAAFILLNVFAIVAKLDGVFRVVEMDRKDKFHGEYVVQLFINGAYTTFEEEGNGGVYETLDEALQAVREVADNLPYDKGMHEYIQGYFDGWYPWEYYIPELQGDAFKAKQQRYIELIEEEDKREDE